MRGIPTDMAGAGTMLSCAVLVLTAVSTALAADASAPVTQPRQQPQPQDHVMHVPRAGVMPGAGASAAQQEAQDRSFKVLATTALVKGALHKGKPKFPFGIKEKVLGALGLGTAAAAASGAGAAGAGAVGLHGLDFTKQSAQQYPIWKVHRYQGLELRPIRLSSPQSAYPYPPEEPQHVEGLPPKEIAAPVPVYGLPAPAETYGPPSDTYGPPAQTYGPPSQTYGPPAQTFGPPSETFAPSAETDIGSGDSLEALSNLGALTDLLPGGSGSGSGGGALSSLSSLFGSSGRSKTDILSLLTNAKTIVPNLIKNAVQTKAPAPAENVVYHTPPPSGFGGFVQNIPGLSHLVSKFQGGGDYVNLPALPELPKLPSIVGLKQIPAIPDLPKIKLPTKLVAQGGTYVRVGPSYSKAPSAISPRNPAPAPAAPVPAPTESLQQPIHPAETYAQPSQGVSAPNNAYTLPLEQPAQEYAAPSRGQPVNSYGLPVSQEVYSYTAPAQQYSTPVQQYSTPVQQYSAPVQQYSAPVQQYSAPVQQYSAPVQQYSAPAQQYSAPVQQYSTPVQRYSTPVQQYVNPAQQYASPSQFSATDAFTSASAPEPSTSDVDGNDQMTRGDADDERAELNENSRSDFIDAASEASEMRVPAPLGETHSVGQRSDAPAVAPVFRREEQARRLEEVRHMVDQMVELATQLDSAAPATAASSKQTEPAAETQTQTSA